MADTCPKCGAELDEMTPECPACFSSRAERSGVLQGCLPSTNCSAEAGAEAQPNSLINSVVPPKEAIPAPPEIKDIVEAMRAEDLRHSMPPMEDDTYNALAWRRWARSQTGESLALVVICLIANCIRSGTKLEAQFLEIYMRVKNTKRRTLAAQRERAIRRNGGAKRPPTENL